MPQVFHSGSVGPLGSDAPQAVGGGGLLQHQSPLGSLSRIPQNYFMQKEILVDMESLGCILRPKSG